MSWDNLDPNHFAKIWADQFDDFENIDIEGPDFEKAFLIATAYQALSKETKEFIFLLHNIPSETLELLEGSKSEYAKRKVNRFIRQFIQPGKGRTTFGSAIKMVRIKRQLRKFVEEL